MHSRRKHPHGLYVTAGGRKIQQYLELTGTRITDFAKKAGVSRVSVRQVIDGERWKFIPVDFAFACSRASDGMIKPEDFLSSTAEKVPSGRRGPPPARRGRTGPQAKNGDDGGGQSSARAAVTW